MTVNGNGKASSHYSQEYVDRMPPCDKEAEKAILGICINDTRQIYEAVRFLTPDRFYVFGHQVIFKALVELSEKGKPFDSVVLANYLKKQKNSEEVSLEYLAELVAAPSSVAIEHLCGIVLEHALLRELIRAGNQIESNAWNRISSASELLAMATERILSITDASVTEDAVDLRDIITEKWKQLDRRKEQGRSNGIPSGFYDLDSALNGWQDGELILLAARPSTGKTACMLAFAAHAIKAGFPALVVSLEQSRSALCERLICMESRTDSFSLRAGKYNSQDQERMLSSTEILTSNAAMVIDDRPGQKMTQIGAMARRMKAKHGIRLMVLDYIQLIEPDNGRASEQEQISVISRRLKSLAKELHIPVICCCQLNRAVEGRQGGKPRLSDLRSTGQLEQDADVVILMSRNLEPGLPEGIIDLDIAKNRDGPTGLINLLFVKQFLRFENFAKGAPAA